MMGVLAGKSEVAETKRIQPEPRASLGEHFSQRGLANRTHPLPDSRVKHISHGTPQAWTLSASSLLMRRRCQRDNVAKVCDPNLGAPARKLLARQRFSPMAADCQENAPDREAMATESETPMLTQWHPSKRLRKKTSFRVSARNSAVLSSNAEFGYHSPVVVATTASITCEHEGESVVADFLRHPQTKSPLPKMEQLQRELRELCNSRCLIVNEAPLKSLSSDACLVKATSPDLHLGVNLACLPTDTMQNVFSSLGVQELLTCITLALSWSNPVSGVGALLFADGLWRHICLRHWATKATHFHVGTPEREAALRAAHPGSCWKRLFHVIDADGKRCEMTPAELKHLCWTPVPIEWAVRRGFDTRTCCQHVVFKGAQRSRGASARHVLRVVRLPSWEWLLIGKRSAFISALGHSSWTSHVSDARAVSDFEDWLLCGRYKGELKLVPYPQ